jgi:hypothetical protein
MSIIGYHKAKNYIITIETDNYRTYVNENDIINHEMALYETKSFIVINIEDLVGNNYDSILDFEVDKTYNYTNILLEFFKIRELAFYLDFILKEQWEFFPDGYAGLYKEYLSNGSIVLEYYHINGKKYGQYKYYWDNTNKIREICYYFDDFISGDIILYNINGTIINKNN